MRLFVGVPVEGELRTAITSSIKALRLQLPGCRWVPAENLHLTVRFLGDIAEGNLPQVGEWFDACAAGCALGPLQLAMPGWFERRDQMVFWLGLRDSEWLGALAQQFAAPLLSIPLEERPFVAHLTIGRCRVTGAVRHKVKTFLQRYEQMPVPDCLQTVTRVVLFESKLSGEGAAYRALRSYPAERAGST